MSIEKILLIAEDLAVLESLKPHLRAGKRDLQIESSALKGIESLKKSSFDLIFCDLELSGLSGIDVLQIAKELHPDVIFIVLSSQKIVDKALAAVRLGAFQYLTKPLASEAIEALLQKILEHASLLQENEFLRKEMSYHPKGERHPIIAKSSAMQDILCDVDKIAKSNASVFITGESGTGKEVIANAIHHLSFRSCKPFIRVNCAAIPDTLLESEFFGHEKGSFTGAIQKRIGRFELADKGTLLLDEISEVPLEIQPKLLRVIQEQEFERVGGTKPIAVDVRLISTSNRNMKESIENKLFREDLFFRLHVVPLKLPALRERKDDIIPLAEYFLEKLCNENLKSKKILSAGAKERLLEYYWPGNVRELANIIERTVVMHSGEEIKTEELKLEFSCPVPIRPSLKWESPDTSATLASIEKTHILATLRAWDQNKTQAAKSLGISLKTLRNKLKIYQEIPNT